MVAKYRSREKDSTSEVETMPKVKKSMGVQQVLLHPDQETESILRYLCEQSGKHYNNGVYFARQTFFKTGRILTGKFDLAYESSVSKTPVAQSLPSSPAQQTLL
jgi:putative transposase